MNLFLEILADATKDTLVLVPFLFVTYLVLESLEHAAGARVAAVVRKAGAAGPIVGGILGVLPQCGFSAMGATLFAGRVVTLGTLLAVFLSTSDEMLPLLVAEQVDLGLVGRILAAKAAIGIVVGLAADAILRLVAHRGHAHGADSLVDGLSEAGAGVGHIHELCERDHCRCEDDEDDEHAREPHEAHDHGHGYGPGHDHGYGHDHAHDHAGHEHARGTSGMLGSVVRGAVSHTVQVTVFIFVTTLVLSALLDTLGEEAIASILGSNAVVATFVSALVGLIPNCAASIVITQLYLDGALGLGPMMAGTLVAGGAGFLVLFRTNRNVRENVCVLAILLAVGIVSGLVILALGL